VEKKVKVEFNLDSKIVEQLKQMAKYKSCDPEVIVTKALKKFISQHRDFFPDLEITDEDD